MSFGGAGLPLVGATAVIAGMAAFSRDAAIVQNRLQAINRSAGQLEAETSGALGGVGGAFASMAGTVASLGVIVVGALAAGGVAAIKFAADLQANLARTQAFTGATGQQMSDLRVEIEALSRSGTLSMNDLADAATELARSGVPIEAVLGGALKAVNDLTIASGGELGLSDAAKLVATSMNAFALSSDEATRITTAATVVAQSSAATFTGFGQAVATAGASFRAAGFSIEDLAIAETILTKNGLSASVAATALRGLIQRLEKPSKDAAKVMQEYGIHLFDAAGKGVGLRAVLGQLNAAFGDEAVASGKVTEQERAQALAALGLQRTSVALFDLAIGGTQAFDDLSAKFQELSASQLVEALLKPLTAQLLIAKNNVVALATAFGERFLPALQDAAGKIIVFLQGLSSDKMRVFGDTVVDAGAAIAKAIGGAVESVLGFIGKLSEVLPVSDFVKGALIGLGVVIATVLLVPLVNATIAFGGFLLAIGAVALIIRNVGGAFIEAAAKFRDWVSQFGPAGKIVGDVINGIMNVVRSIIALLNGDFASAGIHAGAALSQFAGTIRTVVGGALEGFGKFLDDTGAALRPWAAGAGTAGKQVGDALSGVHGIVQALQFTLQGNFPAAAKSAQQGFDDIGAAIQPLADALGGALQTAIEWVTKTGWPALQSGADTTAKTLSDTLIPALQNLATAIEPIGPASVTASAQFTTSFAGALEKSKPINDLVQAFHDLMAGFDALEQASKNIENIFKPLDKLTQPMSDSLSDATANIDVFGGMAQGLVFDIKNLTTGVAEIAGAFLAVSTFISDATGAIATFERNAQSTAAVVGPQFARAVGNAFSALGATVRTALDALPGIVSTAFTVVVGVAIMGVGAVVTAVSTKLNQIRQEFQDVWNQIPQDIRDDLNLVITLVGQRMGELFSAIGSKMREIQTAVSDAWNNLVAATSGILAGLAAVAGVAWDMLAAAVLGRVDATQRGVSDGFNGMLAAIIETMTPIVDAVTMAWDIISTLTVAAVELLVTSVADKFNEIFANITAWGADVVAAVTKVGAELLAAGIQIGQDIINGMIAGLRAGADAIGATAAAVARGALAAAKEALGAHSPSTEFEALGVDVGEGLITGLAKIKLPVRNAAVSLADQVLAAFRDTIDKSGQLMADFQAQATQIGEDVGRKINEATLDAQRAIQDAIDQATQRIQDAGATISQSRSDRARRENLTADQQARRDARKKAQEDADAELKRKQDINAAKFQLDQDLEKASTQKERDAAQEKFKQKLEDIDQQAKVDADNRERQRQRAADDAKFERDLAAETRALDDQLEDEALARTIARTNEERDNRIRSINEALAQKQKQLIEQGAREIEDLRANTQRKIQILEDEFANKAVDILQKGGEAMRPLIEKIADALQIQFNGMRQSADEFTGSVRNAINALNELDAARSRADVGGSIQPPGVTAPSEPIRGPVPPEFQHGGMVPGPWGKPMMAVVHGGEFIVGLDTAVARMMHGMAPAPPPTPPASIMYEVNATYANEQSPASVELDMRALVALSRSS